VVKLSAATEECNAKYVEHRVPHLVGKNVEELTDHRIHWGDDCLVVPGGRDC